MSTAGLRYFMESRVWLAPSRLTYSAYLVHFIIINVWLGSRQSTSDINGVTLVTIFTTSILRFRIFYDQQVLLSTHNNGLKLHLFALLNLRLDRHEILISCVRYLTGTHQTWNRAMLHYYLATEIEMEAVLPWSNSKQWHMNYSCIVKDDKCTFLVISSDTNVIFIFPALTVHRSDGAVVFDGAGLLPGSGSAIQQPRKNTHIKKIAERSFIHCYKNCWHWE